MSAAAQPHLLADRETMRQFAEALFRYADDETYIALRAFDQFDRGVPPCCNRNVRIDGDLNAVVDIAARAATALANNGKPTVFAPPIATFQASTGAATRDLANGLTLSVEVDQGNTTAVQRRLEGLLGPCTVIVASGSEWCDPETGEVFPCVHLHWRLSEPTRDWKDHDQLAQARSLAALLVGADKSGVPICHPLRWPGTWNVKRAPKMARIAAIDPACEINLIDALDVLIGVTEREGKASADIPESAPPEAPKNLIESAVAAIPNPGTEVHYGDWISAGYAIWRATGGSGFIIWDAWSKKSDKYNARETEEAWRRIGRAIRGGKAHRTIGAGTIFYLAKKAGWKRPAHSSPPPQGPQTNPGHQEPDSANADQPADEPEGEKLFPQNGAVVPYANDAHHQTSEKPNAKARPNIVVANITLEELADDDGFITEDSVALAFTRQYRDQLRFDHYVGKWYHWDGAAWRREETKLALSPSYSPLMRT